MRGPLTVVGGLLFWDLLGRPVDGLDRWESATQKVNTVYSSHRGVAQGKCSSIS